MDQSCSQCVAIKAFEQNLDQQAQVLLERIKVFQRPQVMRNNRRWQKLADLYNNRLLGWAFRNLIKRPFGLEVVPSFFDFDWYKQEAKSIREEAEKLEAKKAADMVHWSDETVEPMNGQDPGGYYTPLWASRVECYAHKLTPFPPDKYTEFYKFAWSEEFNTFSVSWVNGRDFFKPAPREAWLWSASVPQTGMVGNGTIPMADNDIVPGFNEWLDPCQVQTIGSR